LSRAVIKDLSYKPYRGARRSGTSIWIIARAGLLLARKSKWMKVLLAASLAVTVGFGVALYIALKFQGLTGQLGVNMPGVMRQLMKADRFVADAILFCGSFFGFFAALIVSGPSVSDDLKGGGLHFHFSRPVGLVDYVGGKVLPTVIAIGVLAFMPAVLLGLMRLAMSPEWEPGSRPAATLVNALGLAGLITMGFSVPAVCMSALTVRRGVARILWALLYWVMWAVGGVLVKVLGESGFALVSLPGSAEALAGGLYGLDKRAAEHWVGAAAVLMAYAGAGLAVIVWRINRWRKKT
jgi:hypothetical protein